MDSQAAVGEELGAVSALQPRLQDRVNALPEAGKAPVDIPVEDPHRRPGALTVAEEDQIEERVRRQERRIHEGVGRQVTRLGQGVGDRRILSVDELGSGSCGDCGAHPAHGPTSLRGIARHLHDPVADGGESPAHGDWPQHRGGNPIRLKREGRVKDHEPGGVAAARGGASTNHAVRAHNATSCLMPEARRRETRSSGRPKIISRPRRDMDAAHRRSRPKSDSARWASSASRATAVTHWTP